MNEYELIYIVTPRRAPAEVEHVGEWLATQVTAGGGEVLSTRTWGRRRMAYPINHNLDGTYVIARLSMPAATAVALEKALHIQEDVIRHMLIRGIMGTDDAPPEFVASERPRFASRPPLGAEPRAEMRAPMAATAEMAPESAVEADPAETAQAEVAAAPAMPESAVAEAPSEPAAEADANQ